MVTAMLLYSSSPLSSFSLYPPLRLWITGRSRSRAHRSHSSIQLSWRPRYIEGTCLVSNPRSDVTNPTTKNEGAFEILEKDGTIGSTLVAPKIRARFVGQGYKQQACPHPFLGSSSRTVMNDGGRRMNFSGALRTSPLLDPEQHLVAAAATCARKII